MGTVRQRLEYAAFLFIRGCVNALSLRRSQQAGALVGRWIGRSLGYRWRVTIENLRAAFPERSSEECADVAGRAFASVGTTLFELLRFDRLSRDAIRALVHIDGEQLLRDAQRAGHGTIVLTAHYGSWELVPPALAAWLDMPGTVLVRGLANPWIDRAVDELRRQSGVKTVPSTLAVRELYRTLQRGGIVLMAADQSAPPEGPAVHFFGRQTPAFEGPAVLALRTGARIVFGVARRQNDGSYRLSFEPITTDDLHVEDPTAARRLTERCLMATEEAIRRDPSQWMWMHRRWKHLAAGT